MRTGIFVGKLGQDPKPHYFDNGNALAEFSMAVDTDKKDAEGKKIPLWITVKAWGKTSNNQVTGTAGFVLNNLKKGRTVAVQGDVDLETWNGNNGPGAKIVCNNAKVTACDPKPQDGQGQQQQQQAPQQQPQNNYAPPTQQQQQYSPPPGQPAQQGFNPGPQQAVNLFQGQPQQGDPPGWMTNS